MRVLQVIAPARFGGAESVCLSLSAALQRAGVQVTVAALAQGERSQGFLDRAAQLGVTAVELRHARRRYDDGVRALRALAAERRVDVLHAHLAHADLLARGATIASPRACVATFHGHDGAALGTLGARLYDLADLAVLRTMDAVVAVSHHGVGELRRRSPAFADSMVVIPSAIARDDAATRESARRALGVPASTTLLGWVGRFCEQKHPELFVETVAALARRAAAADWRAVMIGDGALMEATRALARALNVEDRITFAGAHANASALVPAFDALAITSRWEQLSTVVLECLAHGVPVVAASVGDVARIAAACSAVTLVERHADAFADAVNATRSTRDAAARAGAEYVARHHDTRRWAEQYRRVYARAIERRTRGRVVPADALGAHECHECHECHE